MTDNATPLPTDVESLTQMVNALQSTIATHESTIAERDSFIERLLEQIRLARHQRFGASSERLSDEQLRLFNEGETEVDNFEDDEDDASAINVGSHKRKKGGRKPLPAILPRVEVVHDLDEAERICPDDGTTLTLIGEKTSEQLDIEPAKVHVIRHVRRQYACPCCEKTVKTAPLPAQPIPRSMASPGLLAHVITNKYVDALPLYRQENILKRSGIELPRATLASWMIKSGNLVQVLVDRLHQHLLDGDIVGMDETTVQVLKEQDRAAQTKSYMWVQRGGPPDQTVVLYHYRTGRNRGIPTQLLDGFAGYLQTDGYAGYNEVVDRSAVTAVGCFAHARRKFDEAQKAQGKLSNSKRKKTLAYQAIKFIGKLYRLERELQSADPEARHDARQERALPVLEEMRTWLDAHRDRTAKKTKLGEAMTYLDNQWPKLINYTEDGRLRIDNNLVENAIRPFVVGRRNWLFSDTAKGAAASANLYSLIETAKANGIEPYNYLRHVMTLLPELQHNADKLDALLPWNMADTKGVVN